MAKCKRHPDIETGLTCNKCGDAICPKCLVQTPVGSRCPSCAKLSRVPTYRISKLYYLRAIGAAIGLAIAGGIAWGFLQTIIFSSFFNILIAGAIGYGVGEGISLSVNRKSGTGLAVIGGITVVLSFLISAFTFWGLQFSPYDIIAVVVGVFVSAARLR
jgi:hypothetical protein